MSARSLVALIALVAAPLAAAPLRFAEPRCGGKTISHALGRYAVLQKQGNTSDLAAFYLPDGTLSHRGGEVLTGPAAIETFLNGFAAYKLISNSLVAEKISAGPETTSLAGHFAQQVRLPDGKMVAAHGGFESDWVCRSRRWRIERLETFSDG